MCGRYQFSFENGSDAMARIRALAERHFPNEALPQGEIFPSDRVPVLVRGEKRAKLTFMTWGYPMTGSKSLIINARWETAAQKPLFRDSFLSRRCAIPSTGYYEWDAEKRKFLFGLPGQGLVYMAGFYNDFGQGPRFVVITRPASDDAAKVHDRMPMLIEEKNLLAWLSGGDAEGETGVVAAPV